MHLKPTDVSMTLEQLDKEQWGEPPYDSTLVLKSYALRKKPLHDFTVEDLRLLIGQNINLDILISIAIEKLKADILAEGDCYEGDLLHSVLSCEASYWLQHRDQWERTKAIYENCRNIFESDNSFRQIRKSFEEFDRIVFT